MRMPGYMIGLLFAVASSLAWADGGPGSITGRVEAPGEVAAIAAIDRATDKKYSATIEPAGRFVIGGLPAAGTFDVLVDYKDGARLEGVNFKVPRSDYEEEQPLAPEDVDTIKGQVKHLNKFEDEVDILAVSGNIQHAAVLVNKLRTRPFVNSKPGEVVWRCELWRFERPEETWVKVQDELFLVLYRQRIPNAEYQKKSITFDASLGGLAPAQDATMDLGLIKRPNAQSGIRFRAAQLPNDKPATKEDSR